MVPHSSVGQELNTLRLDVVPPQTQRAFLRFIEFDFSGKDQWYLAGGTALALQVGHRESVDLDFFTQQENFTISNMEKKLSDAGDWSTTSVTDGTLYGEFLQAKISFIAYPSFRPAAPMLQIGSVNILNPVDIGAMKVIAVSQRGRKRDFYDLYWLCQNVMPLADFLSRAQQQYTVRQNLTHLLKSLVFFADGEDDPNPVIHFTATWKEIKEYFKGETQRIAVQVIQNA